LPRKTDASNPADWLWMAEADLEVVRLAAAQQLSFTTCRSKLAEVLETDDCPYGPGNRSCIQRKS